MKSPLKFIRRMGASTILVGVALYAHNLTAFAVSDLAITNIFAEPKDSEVVITVQTNFDSGLRIDFGVTDRYGSYIFSGESVRSNHLLKITNLTPETTYHYRATVYRPGTEVSSFDRMFKTTKLVDTGAPVISNVHVAYVTGSTATIQWETSEPATSVVRYGPTSAYSRSASGANNTRTHDVTVSGLSQSTTYHFQVESKDAHANAAVWHDLTFTTLLSREGDTAPLRITELRPVANDASLGADKATVSWRTNKLANGTVRYGTSTKLGKTITAQGMRTFEHVQLLEGLTPDTLYYYSVESRDVFGKSLRTELATFRTKTRAAAISEETAVPIEEPIVHGFATVVSTPASTLLREQGGHDLFALLNGRRYRLVNLTSLNRYARPGVPVRELDRSGLERYPSVTLVKSTESSTVYYLYRRLGNRFLKLAIPSPSVFTSYPANRWDAIVTLPPEELMHYADLALVRASGASEVYLLERGTRRLITSAELSARGFTSADIGEISKTHLAAIPLGDPVQ